uniref:DUF295 domain-containing protein n=1 Tax=Leersia perrieri TaxID=77586 RepID=A0A0D9XTT2_9ORYZ
MGAAVSKKAKGKKKTKTKTKTKGAWPAMAASRDGGWSALPEDVLLTVMQLMDVPDVVRSGAACSAWRAAFRRLRLPTPRQPPCLLYACESYGPSAAALFSPSSTTFRVPFCGGIAGSAAHGWLFTTDDDANPFLLNPLTGARAALPPITTLHRVKTAGGGAYGVDFALESPSKWERIERVTAKRAREWMFRRVAVSAAGAGGGGGGVVLLMHMPYAELYFASPGDARWTSLSVSGAVPHRRNQQWLSVVHDDDHNGLFYLLRHCGSVFSLDLAAAGHSSPVVRTIMDSKRSYPSPHDPKPTKYLAVAPRGVGGELLLLVTRRWRKSMIVSADKTHIEHGVVTTGVEIEEIRIGKYPVRTVSVSLTGIGGDHALFLGHGSAAVCVPTKDLSMLRPNCAYLTDDIDGDLLHSPATRRDVGVWDFESSSLHKLGDVWPLRHPWLYSPPPIWITPSLY